MQQRPFGSSGIDVSVLGLGTVKLGRNQGVKYPESFTIPDDREALALISLASELGINLIDTAPAYGTSEERLGKLLKGRRSDWVICSKVGEEFDNGDSYFDFSAAHTRMSVERSLRRLNTDCIDIVLAHSDGNDLQLVREEEVLDELERMKQRGLIRAYGASTKTVEGGLLAAQQSDGVMATYNLSYRDEEPVLDFCAEHHKGALIKKAFASGHLCTEGEDPVQRSLDLVLGHPGVSSVIIGTINPEHLRANVAAALNACR